MARLVELKRRWLPSGLCLSLSLVAAVQVVSTYTIFSETVDEHAHVAAGMEWLERGRYTYQAQHPPLARVAAAVPLYLAGVRGFGEPRMHREGTRILNANGAYRRNLALARAGILPFLILASAIVWAWCRRSHGDWSAVGGVALFTTLPPVLAHGGLATTDMALTATVPAALLAFCVWLDRPSRWRSILLGIAVAAAVLSKLSALVFLPAAMASILAVKVLLGHRERRTRVERELSPAERRVEPVTWFGQLGVALLTTFLVIWAGYRFSISYPVTLGGHIPFPAGELVSGILEVAAHNAEGHAAYLLGQYRQTGWWYFFPVAYAVKSPIPFQLLALIGTIATTRRAWATGRWSLVAPLVSALAIMGVSMGSRINIGVRHILPIFSLLAVTGGVGAVIVWEAQRFTAVARSVIAGLFAWMLACSARAYPDYLAYFNEFAGSHPERILNDSDLCWGQDFFRLVDSVRARHIRWIWVAYHGSIDQTIHSLPSMHVLQPNQRVTGWVAVSLFKLKGVREPGFTWLASFQPVFRAGPSIWVFDLPSPLGADTSRPMRLGRHD